MAFLSIVTLTDYDDTLWDGFTLPTIEQINDGILERHELNKDLAIAEICLECSDLELIYSDWDYMQFAISAWAAAEQPVWRKMYETTLLKYNPLWNVDADIVETNSGSNSGTSGGTDTQSVTGYNSATMVDHTKDTTSGSSSGSWEETHTTRRTGNIGVTSSMQLIREQRDVVEFNMYKYIVDSFKKRFCLMVY